MADDKSQTSESQPEQQNHPEEQNVAPEQGEISEEDLVELQDVMADYVPTEQLDSRFAVIEEQFRKSFDERFGSGTKKQFWEDEAEMMRTSKIFREVSRNLGDEWKPIFTDLMAKFPPEVVEEETKKIEQQPLIIQSYKALTTWKDIMGPNYMVMQLVDVLRKHNMDDLADEVLNIVDNVETEKKDDKAKTDDKSKTDDKTKASSKPIQRKKSDVNAKAKPGILDNRRLLLLAKKIGAEWEPLAKALAVSEEEITEIREGEDGKTYQGGFKALWAWRQTQPATETEEIRNVLKAALEKVGKKGYWEELETK